MTAGCERPDAGAGTPPAAGPEPPPEPPPEPEAEPAGDESTAEWWPHDNGRWVVGDAGQQPKIIPLPAAVAPVRPDTTLDGARLANLDYRAVSLRGFSHWQAAKPRQDAYLLRVTSNQQWLVGCVADGVSSAIFSHAAADLACRVITRQIAEALADYDRPPDPGKWEGLVGDLPWQAGIDRASAAIVTRAAELMGGTREQHAAAHEPAAGIEPPRVEIAARDARTIMATTAVAFAVAATRTPDGLVPYAVAVASGDSSALVLSDGRWHPITAVKNADGEVASNAVLALPRQVQARPVSGFLRPGEALVIISDGLGDPLGQGTGVVGRFLAAQWSRPPDLLAFAAQAAFYRRTFTDDRTAVVVWHRAGPSD